MAIDIAVKVNNVSKSFKLPHERHSSIKSVFVNFFRGSRTYEKQRALTDVTLEIKQGEFFGIVGRNGGGKSTLLKMMAGIYSPDKGSIKVSGSLTPFIELGVGFNPELTGRENVFLNGALLGFSRREMEVMYQDIVDFAEIERFMDQKLKNYSSGMQVRLAFSIAIRAKSDILLLDEVLAVGDLAFQRKCQEYFATLKTESRTVILVTHDMASVRKFCNRCALIENGKIVNIGNPKEITEMYSTLNLRSAEDRLGDKEQGKLGQRKKREGNGGAEITHVKTYNTQTKKTQNTFTAGEKIGIEITFLVNQKIVNPAVGFIFQNDEELTVFATNNSIMDLRTKTVIAGETLTMRTVVDNVFTDGKYSISCAIESDDFLIIYDRIEHIYSFLIGGNPLSHALVHPYQNMAISYTKPKQGLSS